MFGADLRSIEDPQYWRFHVSQSDLETCGISRALPQRRTQQ